MATWTNVPDSNLEPGDPIRSVDIIAIKENTVYNREHTILDILNSQTFTASTTWTRPGGFDATDSVIAIVIGGGGSGGMGYADIASGGGGGGVAVVSIPYGTVTSTVSVTVGLGGAAVAGGTANGNPGGISGFGSYIRASGGRGGFGGSAATGVGGGPLINANSNISSIVNGGNGRTQDTTLPDGYTGGGGAFNTSNQFYIGVVSSYFGSGGNAATWTSGAATAGSAPGGGGGAGGSFTTVSAAGARGEVRVYIVRGKVPANIFLGTTSVSVAY
jgi:hypothetical protein